MTDITTQEVENMIEKFTGMFDHIRNTFINASQLADKVNELSQQVARLQADVESTASRNATLEAAIQSMTEQRNAVVQERDSWRDAHHKLEDAHDQLHNEHEDLKAHAIKLESQLNEHVNALDQERELTKRLGNENALLQERLRRTQRYIDNMKATLEGDQTRDVDNGQFEPLPKVQAQGGW